MEYDLISDTERDALLSVIRHNTRLDGRGLCQERYIHTSSENESAENSRLMRSETSCAFGSDITLNNHSQLSPQEFQSTSSLGKCYQKRSRNIIRVQVGSGSAITEILAYAHVRIRENDRGDYQREMDADESHDELSPVCNGTLSIHLDAMPFALVPYIRLMGCGNVKKRALPNQVRERVLAHFSDILCGVFGAEVFVRKSTDAESTMEAFPLSVGAGTDNTSLDEEFSAQGNNETRDYISQFSSSKQHQKQHYLGRGFSTGFPGKDLYIGDGFAFHIDVDILILQSTGGNVLGLTSSAIQKALSEVFLPNVILSTTPDGGKIISTDYSTRWEKSINWSLLPHLMALRLTSNHRYIVDPSLLEELTFPQYLYVAITSGGKIVFINFGSFATAHLNDFDILQPTDLKAAIQDAVMLCIEKNR